MSKIVTVPFTEAFLPHVVAYLHEAYSQGKDLSRIAVVFGGHRPSLFIKRDLARLIGKPYMPPAFFTIDAWMSRIAYGQNVPRASSMLDHCFAIYQLAKRSAPEILKGREQFALFLPWAQEILHFIEQLDLEDVPLDSLKVIEEHARIGFSVPEDINRLLGSLCVLRKGYHAYLKEQGITTRGYQYLQAARKAGQGDLSSFDEVLFCNFFYLHRSENTVLKSVYDRIPTILFMQGDARRWPALERIAKTFGAPVREGDQVPATAFDLKIYEAFDSHAQAALVKQILRQIDDPTSTVVVLPDAEALLPLLASLGKDVEEFNISMGYPLKRSALYTLLEMIAQAQNDRKDGLYYARDYLKLLSHPLVKNLNLAGDEAQARVMVHRVEEVLKGVAPGVVSGALFLDLQEVLDDDAIWQALPQAHQMKEVLSRIHRVFFEGFEDLNNSADLGAALFAFTDFMGKHSHMGHYPFNTQIVQRLAKLAQELRDCSFSKEPFGPREMFRILKERLSLEIVAFRGSPLRGLQVLGLFETRALNFKHVIIVDVNEGVLPNLNIYERLVPREVMVKLKLDRLELEDEIQRYGFMRLISSARQAHLIYQQNTDKVPSRFVEELVWEQERRKGEINSVEIIRPCFQAAIGQHQRSVPKTAAVMEFLKGFRFSASSLNAYLNNPYDFYFQYVLGLKPKDDLLAEPESRHIGTFIHGLLDETFRAFIGKKPVLDEAFRRYFQRIFAARFESVFGRSRRGDQFLLKTVLETRLERFLDEEAVRCRDHVEQVLFVEKKFEEELRLGTHRLRMVYKMDRVDLLKDNTVLVLDYKTGGTDALPKEAGEIEGLPLTRSLVREKVRSFQMPLYVQYLSSQYPGQAVDASLYYLRSMELKRFMPKRTQAQREYALPVYMNALKAVVDEIMDIDQPFADDLLQDDERSLSS